MYYHPGQPREIGSLGHVVEMNPLFSDKWTINYCAKHANARGSGDIKLMLMQRLNFGAFLSHLLSQPYTTSKAMV